MSGCGCGSGSQEPCACPEGGQNDTRGVGGDLMAGGTGMSMRRFKSDRVTPGGLNDWGSPSGWVGFRRPVQRLEHVNTVTVAGAVPGAHLNQHYVDAQTGAVVSLMGDPTADGHLFPDQPSTGAEFACGRPW